MATNFGREMSCTDSVATGRYVSGARVVAEACYRRLITPRGMLRGGEDEDNYGHDLTQYIGAPNPKLVAAKLPGLIAGELRKDPRVDTVEVDIASTTDGPATSLVIVIRAETADGPFTLQVGIDEVTVALLGIEDS